MAKGKMKDFDKQNISMTDDKLRELLKKWCDKNVPERNGVFWIEDDKPVSINEGEVRFAYRGGVVSFPVTHPKMERIVYNYVFPDRGGFDRILYDVMYEDLLAALLSSRGQNDDLEMFFEGNWVYKVMEDGDIADHVLKVFDEATFKERQELYQEFVLGGKVHAIVVRDKGNYTNIPPVGVYHVRIKDYDLEFFEEELREDASTYFVDWLKMEIFEEESSDIITRDELIAQLDEVADWYDRLEKKYFPYCMDILRDVANTLHIPALPLVVEALATDFDQTLSRHLSEAVAR